MSEEKRAWLFKGYLWTIPIYAKDKESAIFKFKEKYPDLYGKWKKII